MNADFTKGCHFLLKPDITKKPMAKEQDCLIETKLMLASIPLRRLDAQQKPVGFGAACIVNYSKKNILLTVAHHVVEKEGGWALEISFDPISRKTLIQPLGQFSYYGKIGSGNNLELIDFAFMIISDRIIPCHTVLKDNGSFEGGCSKTILRSELTLFPDSASEYGFCGQVDPAHEIHPSMPLVLSGRYQFETRMKYVGSDENDLYVFKLNHRHLGDDCYYGCSGAPILDRGGNLVSLVVSGDSKRDIIRGVPLAKYKTSLDSML